METDLRALFRPGAARPSGWRRMPTVTAEAMLATSHPVAAAAGMDAFRDGGNAVDAALAAAAALTVAEPTDNGLGGDAFAIVWHDGELHGLNGSGRSPRVIDEIRVDETGPRSVTVPGAVRAWADLAERFGRLGLDRALSRAAELAARGVACTPRIADKWTRAATAPFSAPSVGARFVLPDLAATLRLLAEHGPDAFYRGTVAESIAAASWLDEDDLADHRSEWVQPLRLDYRGVEVCELPPNGQGAAALVGLALYDGLEPGLHSQIEAMKLALADAHAHFADAPFPASLLAPDHLAARRSLVDPARALDPTPSTLPRGGTTYLCAVDADGTAISLIQSVYETFGSGIVAPGTGVVLQNRAAGSSRKRAIRIAWRPLDARSTRSSRACCSRGTSCSAPSASWAAGCSRRATSSSCCGWSITATTPRRRSTLRAGAWATVVRYTSNRGSGVTRTGWRSSDTTFGAPRCSIHSGSVRQSSVSTTR